MGLDKPESNLVLHARRELEAAGFFKPDSDYDGALGPAVMELVEVFSRQGHSGFSAGQVRGLFNLVAAFKPVGPLTGDDSEWIEIDDDEGLYQNVRCSRVFKDSTGAYDIEGRVFEEPNGVRYTRGGADRGSRVYVEFPYTPTTEIVKVDADGNPIDQRGL